jgi:hypothetical protein
MPEQLDIRKTSVYTNADTVDLGKVKPVVLVDLNTGRQLGDTSDASGYPKNYDFFIVVADDGSGNPTQIEFYYGGSYNTTTGEYTGGTLQFTQWFVYDSGEFVSRYVSLNDAPIIDDQTFDIDEDQLVGSTVDTVVASDPNTNQTITFAITDGNDDGVFEIDPDTGIITTAELLDFSETPQYILTIEVTDNGTPVMSSSASITIDINDVP